MLLSAQSLLAAFSGLEIAIMICIIALAVALIVISVLVVVYSGKKRNASSQGGSRPHPIIIYRTIPVKAAPAVASAPVAQPVEPEPEPEPVVEAESEVAAAEAVATAEEDGSENAMRYDRSFRARLIQSEDQVKEWYASIKNDLLSFDRVSCRISWKHESFSYRRNPVAKLVIKGKTLCLYLALNPADYKDSKYKLEDVSKIAQFADTPSLYRIKSDKRVRYAQDLVAELCAKLGSEKTEREAVDYYEPYNGDLALIKKGLIRRVFEDASKSFIGASGFSAAQDKDSEPEEKN